MSEELNQSKREQAAELIVKVATACSDYDADVVLLVLESALAESISMHNPAIGELFNQMLRHFKEKATVLLQLIHAMHSGEDDHEA